MDVMTRLADGTRYRERRRLSITSKSAAQRWGQERERHLLLHGPAQIRKEVPTLQEFAPRFIEGHARANQHKPSGVAAKEMIVRVHLIPVLGDRPLDTIRNEDVQRVKLALKDKAPKTVNNVLTVLNIMLKKAVEWDVVERLPCMIRLLKVPKPAPTFHDFDEYERLVENARAISREAHLIVLLGGEAGLRCGEMIALEWRDVDLGKRQICVQRSDWNGQVTTPKGGRLRYVPLTIRLAAAFRDHRHLRSISVGVLRQT